LSVDEIRGTWGSELIGKKIIMCVTGSVAAYKTPDIARALIRHGAEIHPIMSKEATKIIHPFTLEWATGNKVSLEITGKLEHLKPIYLKADLIMVVPATANTINKIANGISDTIVTATVNAALGTDIPIIIVPAMHAVMYTNPILRKNINCLKELGVKFIEPTILEEKAKLAEIDDIKEEVIHTLYKKDMKGLKVLVTAGPTLEYIDPIRVISNKSSGKMGIELARNAWYRGADVTLVYGPGIVDSPKKIKVLNVETTEEMFNVVKKELTEEKYDIVVAAAAAADFRPEKQIEFKIPSYKVESVELKIIPTPKIIDMVKRVSPETFLVAFKAEYGLSEEKLIEKGFERLVSSNSDLIVVNDVSKPDRGFRADTNEVYIVDRDQNVVHIPFSTKRHIANRIFDIVLEKLKGG